MYHQVPMYVARGPTLDEILYAVAEINFES